MRIRNVKDKEEIINNSRLFIKNPDEHIGKWHQVFGNDNPIYLEIGIGKGGFIFELAENNPDKNFVGLERADSILALAIKRNKEDLTNLKLILIDAKELTTVFNNEVTTIYLNFSDPWPKKRHIKRRLTHESFLSIYEGLLKEKKHIIMKTDNLNLYEYSTEQLLLSGYELTTKIKPDISYNVKTEYETKFLKKGMNIYKINATK